MNSVQLEAYKETLRLAAEYYKQLPTVPKPTSTVTSNNGIKETEEDESVYVDSVSNREVPALLVPAVPISVLHQWYLYTCFAKQALCRSVDWRAVLPFVDAGGGRAAMSGPSYVQNLARSQVQEYGHTSFPALYQCAVRWTIILYKLIRDRVRYLFSYSQTREEPATTPEYLFAEKEGEQYIRLFLHNAQSFLTTSQHTLLGNLLYRKQLEEEPPSTGNLDVQFPPSNGHPFSTVIVLSHKALNTDVLKITWDIVNPNHLAGIVTDKLQHPKNVLSPPNGDTQTGAAASHSHAVHTATFELLFKWLDSEAGQGGTAGPTKPLNFDEVSKLQAFLEQAAYVQTVKWESGFLEFSYYSFPFVTDFAVWRHHLEHNVKLLKSQGVPFVGTTLFLVRELEETLASCSYVMYIQEIQNIYQDYSKNAKEAGRQFLSIPLGKVSPNTVRVLAQVIEPTMDLTRRVQQSLPAPLLSVVREYIEELNSVIFETVQTELKSYETSRTPFLSALAKTDLEVVRQYLGADVD